MIARDVTLAELRRTAAVLIEELEGSARRLLSVIERLKNTPYEDSTYEALEAELSVLATDVRLDAASVESILEKITDHLPDEL
ncbi:MAG: hypothetical protein KGZ60_05900 [Truepera sp.]|nr:hypothetical protein [Truepera sp.]